MGRASFPGDPDALDAALDAAVRAGATLAGPGGLDPSPASVLRRLRALDVAPGPRPAFADRLWADLLGASAPVPAPASASGATVTTGPAPAAPGPTRLRVRTRVPEFRPASARWWPPLEYAAAAVLILALLGAALAAAGRGGGPDGPTRVAAPDAPVVAADGTPAAGTPGTEDAGGEAAMLGAGPARTNRYPDPGPRDGAAPLWRFEETAFRAGSWLVEADGALYATGANGPLVKLVAASGRELWRVRFPGIGASAPVVAGETVYLAYADAVRALDAATGAVLWERDLGGPVGAPLLAGDRFIVTVGEAPPATPEAGEWPPSAALVALSAADGTEDWRVAIDPGPAFGTAADDGRVYVTAYNDLYAFDLATGTEVWRFGTGSLLPVGPTVSGDTVLVGSERLVIALDAADGTDRWRGQVGAAWVAPFGNSPSFTVADGAIQTGAESLDLASGEARWRDRAIRVFRGVVVGGDTVYAALGTAVFNPSAPSLDPAATPFPDANLLALDPATGAVRWGLTVDGLDGSGAPPVVAGSTLYVMGDGFVAAFGPAGP